MRNQYLFGNWKMNKNGKETANFLSQLDVVPLPKHVYAGLALPYIFLEHSVDSMRIHAPDVFIMAQNVASYDNGAYTGEISAQMLANIGVTWSIVGHSERRGYFHETDQDINAKIKQCYDHNIRVVLCMGEDKSQHEAKTTEKWLQSQIKNSLKNLSPDIIKNVIIAYEPIWAIGTGLSAEVEIASDTIAFIRQEMTKHFGMVGENISILYGGSVKPSNFEAYWNDSNIDGVLIGRASLDLKSFQSMLQTVHTF